MSQNYNEKEYQTILNNLLDVSPNDSAIFTRVNNKFSFDFYRLFGPESFNFIYNSKNFDLPILEINLIRIINLLEKTSEAEEIVNILNEYGIEISESRKIQLRKNPAETKEKIISELRVNFQKQTLKWKLFLNKANEINEETNIWPMHLAFVFVRLVIDNKTIYGPLFLKEVFLEIRNGRPFLVSNGDIKPNEKLLFLLNNAGFDLNISENFGDWTIKQLINHLKEVWKDIFDFNLDLNLPFENKGIDDIKNEAIEFKPGVVLGLFQPAGGYVRNRMLEIIKNKQLNKILDIEFNKNIYKKRIKDTITNPKTSIFKITSTNYSQDKAIASSLNQNTIIWGPPGTGKSQTIVNILTNLLVYGKNSLVCSQKKAALEVIKNRMGELKSFCLFMLNSRNMNKKNFYLPIRNYLDFLENFEEETHLQPLKIISQKDINFVENIANFAKDEKFIQMAKVISVINFSWENFSQELWNSILALPKKLIYPEVFDFEDSKFLAKKMLQINKVYWKFWNPKNWKIKQISEKLFNEFKTFKGNLNEIIKVIDGLKKDDFTYLNDLINILPINNENEISDQDELKRFIAKKIIKKINNFTEEEMAEYNQFAATVRLSSIEPYKVIKRFANTIKKIFPIIIVTPEVDLSPWERNEFDYAILDESSQIFIEKGLPILYLAKIKILAGDDQQMKPSNWFGTRVNDDESIYGKVDSLLDFAKSLGVYNVLLDKNYRSNYAALMTFSSKYFYNSSLDVIDTANSEFKYQPIELYEVDGTWENNQNQVEAELAIKLLKENLDKYNKIILLCFNAKQQDSITTEIFKFHPILEKAINDRKLLLRNIENIQGDEADLVIASIAYDKNTMIHSTYVGRPGGKNALNVAISRAKDKMIVIKSLKASDLTIFTGNDDALMFKRWLEFLELSDEQKRGFLDLEKNQNINKSNEEELPASPLNKEIEQFINDLIKYKPFLKLCKNENLGTLKMDYILKRSHESLLCFIIDDYKYANNLDAYITFNDLAKFIRSKKYTVYQLDRILWESKKQEIADLINSFENIYPEEIIQLTNDISTSQLEILDENDAVDELTALYELDKKDEKQQVPSQEQSISLSPIENKVEHLEQIDDFAEANNKDDEDLYKHQENKDSINYDETDAKEINILLDNKQPKNIQINIIENNYGQPLPITNQDDDYIERPIVTVKSFDENTKLWQQILTGEISIKNQK